MPYNFADCHSLGPAMPCTAQSNAWNFQVKPQTEPAMYFTSFRCICPMPSAYRYAQEILHLLLSWVVFCLGMMPSFVGRLPVVGCFLSWIWAAALYFDSAVKFTPSQRRAVARLLATALPEDPILVICQWDIANAAGAWHQHQWPLPGVQSAVVARLQQLGAQQSTLDPNVFYWRKLVGN